jgi:hypothetical protein
MQGLRPSASYYSATLLQAGEAVQGALPPSLRTAPLPSSRPEGPCRGLRPLRVVLLRFPVFLGIPRIGRRGGDSSP